jgi:hypothetical protein
MLDQLHYRWVNDDGDEDAASFAEALDTPHTVALDTIRRLRVLIDVADSQFPTTADYYRLEAKNQAGGDWFEVVPPESTDAGPIILALSSNISSSGEVTTARLTPPSGKTTANFDFGRLWDDESGLDAITLGDDAYTELEFSIRAEPDNGAVAGQTYDFRVTRKEGAAAGGAAPVFDLAGSANAGGNPGPSSITTSFTVVGAGAADFLCVRLAWDNTTTARTVISITYAGAPLTQVASALSTVEVGGEQLGSDIWWLAAPASGANDLVTTFSGTVNGITHGWDSWAGVHQTSPVGTAATSNGTDSSADVVVDSASGEVVVGIVASIDANGAGTSSGDTQRWENSNAAQVEITGNGSSAAGAASVMMDWTVPAVAWCASGVSLKPA